MGELQKRLRERGATPRTLAVIDKYKGLAERVAGNEHTTQLRVLQKLLRAPEAARDTTIYNDLVGLEEELEAVRDEHRREREALEARPIPKLKKHYKQQKAKERGRGA
jgi:hypothetical protein